MRDIIFTEDYATKKDGDSFRCDGTTASHLVRVAKVAKYTDVPDSVKETETGKTTEKTGETKKKGFLGFGKK